MRQTIFALLFLLPTSVQADHSLVRPGAGWYVILGSFLSEAAAHQRLYSRCLNNRIPPDAVVMSDDIIGFTPGYHVVIIGPLESKAVALEVRNILRPCVPDAYVKFGEELFDY